MSKQRPCDACGGSRRTGSDPRGPRRKILSIAPGTDWTRLTLDCGHVAECNPIYSYAAETEHHCFRCGVCLACSGRGWQSDAMPASDALADAETLRNIASQPIDYSPEYQSWIANPIQWTLRDAAAEAYMSVNGARDFANERARNAARAAFRAVPGLRG